MAETAENVAAEHGIARTDQDKFALRSQQRAGAAQANGRLGRRDRAGHGSAEEGTAGYRHRRRTSAAGHDDRGALKAESDRSAHGTVTAGNASGINDGSSALLLASEDAVRAHGLTPRARYVASAVAGVAPRVMGIGPVPATESCSRGPGSTIEQMDVIELNEAFAAQALAVLRGLGVPDDAPHVNPNGGAIAIGHPLGASGARLVTTAMYQLGRTGGRRAMCTMCIGVGQGISVLIERV